MSELPQALPSESSQAYQRYLNLPATDKSALQSKIRHYLDHILSASDENHLLDSTLAKSIANGLQSLIEKAPESQLAHVQAAVYYFVESDDVTPDSESIAGFDDDFEVYNAVCEHLGFPELKVDL